MTAAIEDARKRAFRALGKQLMQGEEDIRSVRAFLQSYHIYDTPAQLFKIWLEEFVILPRDEGASDGEGALPTSNATKTTAQRMIIFVKEWMDKQSPPLARADLYHMFKAVQERMSVDVANELKLLYVRMRHRQHLGRLPRRGSKMDALLISQSDDGMTSDRKEDNHVTSVLNPLTLSNSLGMMHSNFEPMLTSRSKNSADVDLIQLPPAVIAAQLTIFEFNIFRKVKCDEFLNQQWKKESKNVVSPNITAMIDQFNRVGYWVATEIVQAKGLKEQLTILKKFIQVASECLALNNFNSFMEILSGLNNSSVQRLKRMWESLSAKYETRFAELEAIMGAKQNFRQYRQELSSKPLPAFPYFGLYLRDFTFIYDGNQTYLADGSINFDLISLLYERMQDIVKYQSVNYSIGEEERIQQKLHALSSYDSHNEDELYQLSLKAEPGLWTNGIRKSLQLQPDTLELDSECSVAPSDDDTSESSSYMALPSVASLSGNSVPVSIPTNVPLPPLLATTTPTLSPSDNVAVPPVTQSPTPKSSGSGAGSASSSPSLPRRKASPRSGTPLLGRPIKENGSNTQDVEATTAGSQEAKNSSEQGEAAVGDEKQNASASIDDEQREKDQSSSRTALRDKERSGEHRTREDKKSRTEREKREEPKSLRLNVDATISEDRRSMASPRDLSPKSGASSGSNQSRERDRDRDKDTSRKGERRGTKGADEKREKSRRQRRHKEVQEAPRCQGVKGPDELLDQMAKAETLVDRYFAQCYQSAKNGTIEVCGERYILFRASALSAEFFKAVKETFGDRGRDFAYQFLFDFGHAMGKSDAASFSKKVKCPNGLDTMLAGPIYFSYTGWAFIEILQARPESGDSFYLYSDHIFSFEAEAWSSFSAATPTNADLLPKGPVCILSAGFSSGWISSCFNFASELLAVELLCKAKGDERCLFVLATENRIHDHIARFFAENKHLTSGQKEALYIPQFLSTTQTYLPSTSSPRPPDSTAAKLRRKLSIKGKGNALLNSGNSPVRERVGTSSTPTNISGDFSPSSTADEEAGTRPVLPPEQQKQLKSLQHKVNREFAKLFQEIICDPTKGEVRLNNERYIFVRGSSISLEFMDLVEKVLEEQKESDGAGREGKRRVLTLRPEPRTQDEDREREKEREEREREELRRSAENFTTNFLFDFASAMGRNDQLVFFSKVASDRCVDFHHLASAYNISLSGSLSPSSASQSALSAGSIPMSLFPDLLLFGLPTLMAYTGWGSISVENSMESSVYEETPKSPAERKRRERRSPACVMASGYVSGYVNGCWHRYSEASPPFGFLKNTKTAAGSNGDAATAVTEVAEAVQNRSLSSAQQSQIQERGNSFSATLPELAVIELSCRTLGHDSCEFMVCVRSQVEKCARTYLDARGRSGTQLSSIPLVDILTAREKADADQKKARDKGKSSRK